MWTKEQIQLLEQNHILPKNCPKPQADYFALVCEKKKLDPFLKQIHLVERNESDGRGGWRKSYTIQAGIDGMRVIAQRNCKIVSWRRWVEKRDDELYGCCEIVTADRGTYRDDLPLSEYVQKKKDGTPNNFWKNMPQTMIKKCAEESVLRMMAPEDLSGVYGDDEMEQADNPNGDKELPLAKEVKELPTAEYVNEVQPLIGEEKPLNEQAMDMFEKIPDQIVIPPKVGRDQEILDKIKNAMKLSELNDIFISLSEEEKPKYLDKLATRKAILKANSLAQKQQTKKAKV